MNRETLIKLGVRCDFIDTHTHTNTLGSDGKYSPLAQIDYIGKFAYKLFKEDIYKQNQFRDLSEGEVWEMFFKYARIHLSITDHNTAMAYETIRKSKVRLPKNLMLYPGIELEVLDNNRNIYDVTIVGIDRSFLKSEIGSKYLVDVVANKDTLEDVSAITQFYALKRIGIEIPELMDKDLRYRKTGMIANDLAHDIMYKRLFLNKPKSGKEENAKAYLIEHGYNPKKGRSTYYRRFITNSDSPFYVDQTFGRLKLKEVALNVLKDQPNAILLISHPGVYEEEKYGTMEEFVWNKYSILLDVARTLYACQKIDIMNRIGFECGHRNMSLDQTKWVKDFCIRNDLIYSAESDFHDPKNKPFHINGGKTFITRDYVHDRWFEETPTFKEW